LKPVLATRQNQPEILPIIETLINERAKLTKRKLKRKLKPIKDESGKREPENRKEKNLRHETNLPKAHLHFLRSRLTVCVSGVWAGVENI
jgi:hypothetical protein